MAAGEHFGRPGVNSMMVVLLVAGIGFVLAGLVAIGFGIPINEFGFGNTLILAGTVGACTGMLLLGLWTAVKELRNITRRLGPGVPVALRAASEAVASSAVARGPAAEDGGFFSSDQLGSKNDGRAQPAPPPSPPPWHGEAAPRDRAQDDGALAPATAEPAPAVKQRRNLLFSSSSRKERERAQARTTEPSMADLHPEPAAAPPIPESAEAPPASFEDAWPRRAGRTPSTFAETSPPEARTEDQPQVTVLKSGVVDGMAYSLYSDGSIEAQMPEGMMRFASIDELRSHLDNRP
jgi:hypothetical protein